MSDDGSTFGVTHPERGEGPVHVRRRRRLYWATTAALIAVIAAGLLDVFAPVLGVDSGSASSQTSDGVVVSVQYPALTRPALASPFAIEVTDPDGFDEPIELAVSRPWIEMWDENGFYPTPSSETGDDRWVVWEFDPPDGDTFRFFYDARLEPGRQSGSRGAVQLRDGERVLTSVTFETEVRP